MRRNDVLIGKAYKRFQCGFARYFLLALLKTQADFIWHVVIVNVDHKSINVFSEQNGG